jgi:hypothetical protein
METPLQPFVDAGSTCQSPAMGSEPTAASSIWYLTTETARGWTFMTVENPDGRSTDVVVKPADLDA